MVLLQRGLALSGNGGCYGLKVIYAVGRPAEVKASYRKKRALLNLGYSEFELL